MVSINGTNCRILWTLAFGALRQAAGRVQSALHRADYHAGRWYVVRNDAPFFIACVIVLGFAFGVLVISAMTDLQVRSILGINIMFWGARWAHGSARALPQACLMRRSDTATRSTPPPQSPSGLVVSLMLAAKVRKV